MVEKKETKTVGEEVADFLKTYDEANGWKGMPTKKLQGMLECEAYLNKFKYEQILKGIEERKAKAKAAKAAPSNEVA